MVDPLEDRQLRVHTTPLQLPDEDIEDGLQVEVGLLRSVLLTRSDQLHQLLVDEVGQLADAWTKRMIKFTGSNLGSIFCP